MSSSSRAARRVSFNRDRFAGLSRRFSGLVVAALVALCPLPFGSTEPTWIALWCCLASVALVTADLRQVSRPHAIMLGIALVTAALFALVVAAQLVPWPDMAHPIWEQASILLDRRLAGRVSVSPVSTVRALGHPLLILVVFCSAFLAAIDRARARTIMSAALYSGAVYAAIGLFQTIVQPNALLWVEKLAYGGDLTGPFVNRNTAATYFGASLILWTIRFVSDLMDPGQGSAGQRSRPAPAAVLRRDLGIDLAGVSLCAVALLLTHSRAGILFSLLALVVTLMIQLRGQFTSGRRWLAVCAGLAVGVALLLEVLGGGIALRIGAQGLVDRERLLAYGSALATLPDFPWLGTGLGTFAEIFPVYRGGEMSSLGVWDRAHNVALELAVELGVPMAALIVTVWIAGLAQLLRGSLIRRRDMRFPLAGFGVGLLGCLHSLVDFSPQIPGFSVFWISLLACALAQSVRRSEARPAPAFNVLNDENAAPPCRSGAAQARVPH